MDDGVSAHTAFEAAAWSARAEPYARLTGRITAGTADALLDAAGVGPGARVLDVGCGPGVVTARAVARGAVAVGVDVAPGMVAEARRRVPEAEFLEGEASALPVPDGAFDAVVAGFLVNHLDAPERAVAAMARTLRAGGRLALSVWDVPKRTRWLGILAEAMDEARATTPPEVAASPPSYRFADEREMAALLEGAGLQEAAVARRQAVAVVRDLDELWEGLLGGSVRTATRLLAQTPEVRARVRAAAERRAAPYRRPDGLHLPVSVVIASARRPGPAGGAPSALRSAHGRP